MKLAEITQAAPLLKTNKSGCVQSQSAASARSPGRRFQAPGSKPALALFIGRPPAPPEFTSTVRDIAELAIPLG